MDSNRSSAVHIVVLTVPELLSSRVPVPAMPAVAELYDGRPLANLRHRMTDASRWRGKGEVCLQSSFTAVATQGGRSAGYGAYHVTEIKFSTRKGPPSCSPPV